MLTNEKSLKNVSLANNCNVSLAEIEGAVSLAQSANCESLANIITICGGTKQTKANRMNELAQAVRSGNVECMDELFELASSFALSIARGMVSRQEDAEDIAQEAMVRLYRNIDTVDAVSSWVKTTVRNLVIDASRKKSNSYEVYELDAPMDNCMGDSISKQRSEMVADMRIEANPEALLESVATRDAFQHVLALLSDNHQKVIRYALIEQKKQDEIASIMGIRRSTVAVHLKNAKAAFRKEFAAHYDVSLFGLKSAYELETNAVSSSFLIFNAELCSALFFLLFFKKP